MTDQPEVADADAEIIRAMQMVSLGRSCGSQRMMREILAVIRKREVAPLKAEIERLSQRAYELAVAIMGGEDAPGYADSVEADVLVKQQRDWVRDSNARADRAQAEANKLRSDCAILLATVDFMEEATGEGPDPEDRAIVEKIRVGLFGTPS